MLDNVLADTLAIFVNPEHDSLVVAESVMLAWVAVCYRDLALLNAGNCILHVSYLSLITCLPSPLRAPGARASTFPSTCCR